MRRLICSMLILTVGLSVAGCGQTPEAKKKRIAIALAKNKPDEAMRLAYEVLEALPDDRQTLLYLAQSQIQLVQLEVGRKTLDALIEKHPDWEDARHAKVAWVFVRMKTSLDQTDFATNEQVQQEYDEAAIEGHRLADWFEDSHGDRAEAEFLRARFAAADAGRVQRLLDAQRKKVSEGFQLPGQPEETPEDEATLIQQYEREIERKRRQAEEHYRNVIDLDPQHFEAIRLYATLLSRREAWSELWVVAQDVIEQEELPVSLTKSLAVLVLMLPEEVQPRQRCVEVAEKLQALVVEDQKKSPDWLLTSARLHLVKNEAGQALPMIEQVLKGRPRDPVARYLLAQAYYEEQRYDDAKEILDKLSTQARHEADVQTLYGLTLMKLNENSLAAEALRRATDLRPNDPLPRRALARLLASEGKLEAVAADIEQIYDDNPTDARNIRLYMQYEQSRDNRKAVERLMTEAEQIEEPTWEHYAVLIDGYNYLELFEKAESYAEKLIRERPDALHSYLRLAEAKLMLGKEDDVSRIVAEMHRRFEEAGSVEQLLGQLYIQRQSFAKAKDLLAKVVRREPNNADARVLYARALASLAMTTEALDQIDRVLDLEPNDPRAHALAARIYQFMGQNELAENHLAKVTERNIQEAQNPALLAQLKLRQGQLDEAAGICNRAIASGNADPMLRMLLANIYIQREEPQLAEDHLLAMVRRQPDNPQAYQLLARYYLQTGNVSKGLVELVRLQQVNESLSRLAQATLLAGSKQYDEALSKLQPVFAPLLTQRDDMALVVADAMAKIYVAAGRRHEAAQVYDTLIDARHEARTAMLRKIDLSWSNDDDLARLRQLDELADVLRPEDESLKRDLLRRYARIDRHTDALRVLDRWIEEEPGKTLLLRWKGEQLIEMGKAADAIPVFEKAVELAPESKTLRQRLALSHMASFDYPAAEAVFLDLAELDTAARITALSELGHLYVNLGLNQRAVEVFDEIETIGRSHDPRIIYVMGKAFAALGRDKQAMARLKLVPSFAPQYPAATVLLAKLEQRNALIEPARRRMQGLAASAKTVQPLVRELLKINARTPEGEELMNWADPAMAIERLEDDVLEKWLTVRVTLRANRRDWTGALATLDRIEALRGDDKTAVARIVLMWRLTKIEEARSVFAASEALQVSPYAPPVAAMLGVPLDRRSRGGLPRFFESLANSDVESARGSLSSVPPMRTLYREDLASILDRPDVTSPQMAKVARALLAAMLAREVGLPQISVEMCSEVIREMHSFIPAHALQVQALIDLRREAERDAALDRVRAAGPSNLLLYLQSLDHADREEHTAAAAAARQLLEKEPNNWYVEYHLAQQLQLAKKYDEAIEVLQNIARGRGPFKLIAVNDISYTMAEHQPENIDRAHAMALKALQVDPNNMPLLDTLGWIEHLQGNHEQAITHLAKSILGLKALPEVHYHLGVVYKQLGNETWARYHLREAALGPEDQRETGLAKDMLKTLAG